MEPNDDPEARIRQLEQPLADSARASELGGTEQPDYSYTPPPQVAPPPPTYGYGGLSAAPGSFSRSRLFWILAAFFVIGMLVLVGGIASYAVSKLSEGTAAMQSAMSSTPRAVTATGPTSSAPPPGASLTVSGVGESRAIACNENIVTVSGVSNTVVITGHCVRLTVSGVKNSITIDTVDTIEASGLENHVTYHSGSPKVSRSGQSNVVEQG